MTIVQAQPTGPKTEVTVTWEKLPPDYQLPDEPVENTDHPLLAAALREALELAGLITASMLVASNFGLCAKVEGKTVVKAPDWLYVPSVSPVAEGEIRRSYTPHTEGDVPTVVMEFLSETDGGEYSLRPLYPYGKWWFYERILQVKTYVIFDPASGLLEVRQLISGPYELRSPDANGRYWIEEIGLFLGVWHGKKAERTSYWLRWWDTAGNLLLWGAERVGQEQQRVEQEQQRAEQAESLLNQERQRAEQLVEKLRAMGINLEEDQ